MNSPRGNLTDTIRQIIKTAGDRGVPLGVIYEQTDMIFPDDKKKILSRIGDMHNKSHEIERITRGWYRWKGRPAAGPGIAKKIWNLLRIRHKKGRQVTTDDLITICGASREYAKERMQFFVRTGICKKTGTASWRMITDPVTMPEDKGKAEKLRRLRAEKKTAAIKKIDKLLRDMTDVRMAVAEID